MASRTVLAVLHEGVMSLNLIGPLDVFVQANEAVGRKDAYRIVTASVGGRSVRSSTGIQMTPDADLDHCAPPDTLLVPGGPELECIDSQMVRRIAELATGARRIVSVCTGTFLLGAAGLLDGRRATTHWAFCDTLAQRFPAVSVDPKPLFVRDGKVSTSAGVTAGVDLALALVEEDLGSEVALAVARILVVFLRRPGDQRQFAAPVMDKPAARHPLRELEEWINGHPAEDLSVEALARRTMLSPRQFSRVFQEEVGTTPGRYVDRVRLDAARRLLEKTVDGLDVIAKTTGHGTTEAMRRAFLRQLGVPPGEYRRRFQSAARQEQN